MSASISLDRRHWVQDCRWCNVRQGDAADRAPACAACGPTAGSLLALFASYDYHAYVTDRDGSTLEIEAEDRPHAIIAWSIAEPKSAGAATAPHHVSWRMLRGSRLP